MTYKMEYTMYLYSCGVCGRKANAPKREYNEPIKQDKELKKISDLDIMKIRKKK